MPRAATKASSGGAVGKEPAVACLFVGVGWHVVRGGRNMPWTILDLVVVVLVELRLRLRLKLKRLGLLELLLLLLELELLTLLE